MQIINLIMCCCFFGTNLGILNLAMGPVILNMGEEAHSIHYEEEAHPKREIRVDVTN